MISFTVVIIAVSISFLIALFWLAIINYNTEFLRWKNNNIFSLALGGIAVVGISGLLQFIFLEDRYLLNSNFLVVDHLLDNSMFFYVAIAALIEEFFKGIVIWWGIKKGSYQKIKEGVIIGMIIGLFFAVAENGIYFATKIDSAIVIGNIFNLVIARTIFSSIAHMTFSSIVGAFIVKAANCINKFSGIIISVLGLLIAVLVHTIFNISVTAGYSWLPIIIIFCLVISIFLFLRNSKL